jgi:putative flavoprotein involved in K+ transport
MVDHDGGIVRSPGVYLMGMPFLRRRKSGLIDGAGDDARELTAHLKAYLNDTAPRMRALMAHRPTGAAEHDGVGSRPAF